MKKLLIIFSFLDLCMMGCSKPKQVNVANEESECISQSQVNVEPAKESAERPKKLIRPKVVQITSHP